MVNFIKDLTWLKILLNILFSIIKRLLFFYTIFKSKIIPKHLCLSRQWNKYAIFIWIINKLFKIYVFQLVCQMTTDKHTCTTNRRSFPGPRRGWEQLWRHCIPYFILFSIINFVLATSVSITTNLAAYNM